MCKYIFRNKERCKEEALPNSVFCVLHIDLPELEEEDFKRLNKLKSEKITAKTNNGDFNFEGAKLCDAEIKGDLNFKDTKFKTPKTQEEACRKAKRICEESDNREDADYHFYREMVARRQLRKQKIVFENGFGAITAVVAFVGVFIEWLLADVTCKYGSEWRRPIYLWAGVTVLCAVLFWLFGGIVGVDGSGAPSFLDALYFSIVTITTLGYGDYHPKAGLFQVLVGFEAVFGIFMWAVFIAIFAREHMR